MPVIVVASPKGGVGKSTTCLLMATEFAHRGVDITLIDSDPNDSLSWWAEASGERSNIQVINGVTEDTVIDVIQENDKDGSLVICDLEGVASLLNTRAMSQADLVVIPCKTARLDVDISAKAAHFLEKEKRTLRRDIPYVVAFTMVRNFLSKEAEGIVAETREAGVDVIRTFLRERKHYENLHVNGGSLHEMPKHKTLDAALRETSSFCDEIWERLVGQDNSSIAAE